MKTGIVVCNFPRAPKETIDALGRFGVATVHEAMGRAGLMQPYMRPIYSGAQIAGSAVTVLAQPGDNWMIHVAIEHCRPGDVLVVGVSAENTDGMFGELMATSVASRGVVGLVIDAGCRDIASLKEMKFPAWSRAISARGTVKATLGSVNIPIVCAGTVVHAGDVVVADDDGVVIVPRSAAANVVSASEQRIAKEEKKRARLAAGELGLDIDLMRQRLAELGLKYFDTAEEAGL
ncbi:MAG: 4-carboxy-4-hydroxy-2-oxoadipate aldolase/oxaloacetate decarboxylase [Candidatus Acidiferrales bacterium]